MVACRVGESCMVSKTSIFFSCVSASDEVSAHSQLILSDHCGQTTFSHNCHCLLITPGGMIEQPQALNIHESQQWKRK